MYKFTIASVKIQATCRLNQYLLNPFIFSNFVLCTAQ